jgi:hypothetical protein
MNYRTTHTRYLEMGFGRRGGFWPGIVAVLSGIVVIALAVLFSALFLGLFVAIAVGVMVRAWLVGRSKPSRPEVIEAEYTVVDPGESAPGASGKASGREEVDEDEARPPRRKAWLGGAGVCAG